MTEKEVDVVAEELARLGGSSWYPGRTEDPVLRVVTERFRERARAAIAALDRYRAVTAGLGDSEPIPVMPCARSSDRLRVGATVIYRPPGDRRAYSCIVDQVGEGQIHLVPQMPGGDGWVREPEIITEDVVKNLEEQGVIARKHRRRLRGEPGRPGGHSR
jgi:hypothetical protein